MPATHPPASELAAYALGKLDADQSADVEAHLAECEPCQEQTAVVPPDMLVKAVADAYALAIAEPDGATLTLVAAVTPSLGAATIEWAGASRGQTTRAYRPPWPGTRSTTSVAPPRERRHGDRLAGRAHGHAPRRRGEGHPPRPALPGPGAVDRFLREVRAAARARTTRTSSRAFDAEQAGDSCLLVMEYVAGDTLADLVKDGPLPVGEACRAVRDAARGLAHAHAAGLVHRDVKPHNLIRAADGTVKVLDFGLAGVVRRRGGRGRGSRRRADRRRHGDRHAGLHRPRAGRRPARRRRPRPTSTASAAPCTTCSPAARRSPTGSILEKLAAHESRIPDPIPGLAADLADVLAKMLAKRPTDRYQTADEVVAALDARTSVPSQSPPDTLPPADEVVAARNAVTASRRAGGASPRRQWRRVLAVATWLMVALFAVLGAVVYKVQRDDEEVVISTEEPDIEVVMLRNGELVRLRDPQSGRTWEFDAATNQRGLVDQPDGLTVSVPGREPFVLRRVGRGVFRITRVSHVVPTPPVVAVGGVRRFDGHTGQVRGVAISADGRHILSGSVDGTARLWDTATGKELHKLDAGTACLAVSLSPGGTHALTGHDDGSVRLWELKDDRPVRRYDGHIGHVARVVFSPDGKCAITAGGDDRALRVWRVADGYQLHGLTGHTETLTHLAVSPDGRWPLTGGFHVGRWDDETTVRLWDVVEGKELTSFKNMMTSGLAFVGDGRAVVAAANTREEAIQLWNLTGPSLVRHHRLPRRVATELVPTADGRRFLTIGNDRRVWDVESCKALHDYPGHGSLLRAVAVSADDRWAVYAGGEDDHTQHSDNSVHLLRLPDPSPVAVP